MEIMFPFYTYTLNIIQGATFSEVFYIKDATGAYVNLSGYTASGYIKNRYSDSGSLLNISPQVDPSYISGLVNVYISGNQTLALPVGQFLYSLSIYSADNSSITNFVRGYANVYPTVWTDPLTFSITTSTQSNEIVIGQTPNYPNCQPNWCDGGWNG